MARALYPLTDHAHRRMTARRVSPEALDAVLLHGRVCHVRGAEIHALGHKEVERLEREGVDLRRYEGLQVVCAIDGAVLTVYRNRDFRGLRREGKHWMAKAA